MVECISGKVADKKFAAILSMGSTREFSQKLKNFWNSYFVTSLFHFTSCSAHLLRCLYFFFYHILSYKHPRKHLSWWRRLEGVFSVTIFRHVLKTSSIRLQDVLEDGKLLSFIMIKTQPFVTSLDFDYVLHHCNAKDSLYIRLTLLNVCA